jgi:hypothetical protein
MNGSRDRIDRVVSEAGEEGARNVGARGVLAILAMGLGAAGLSTAGCAAANDQAGDTTVRGALTGTSYDVTFRLTSVTPGEVADSGFVETGIMLTSLAGVAFPPAPPPTGYTMFFECGTNQNQSCFPTNEPQFYPDPGKQFGQTCPSVAPPGGVCALVPGIDIFTTEAYLRSTNYLPPVGVSTVPLTVKFRNLDGFDGGTSQPESTITLNVDLPTGTVSPVLPTHDPFIGNIVNNCAIFNTGSSPGSICFAVDVRPVANRDVIVPYQIQSLLYMPPLNKSSVSYGSQSTIGTRTAWTATTSTSDNTSVRVSYTQLLAASGGFGSSASSFEGGSVSTQAQAGVVFSINMPSALQSPCNEASCDFSADPNHDFDLFYLQLGIHGTEADRGSLGKTLTLDLSSGQAIHLSVGDLKLIVQGNYDAIDPIIRDLVQEFIQPADAQQIIDQDPYLSGQSIDNAFFSQHPERFEPACTTPGPCPSPAHVLIQAQTPTEPESSGTVSNVFGNGTDQTTGTSTGVKTSESLTFLSDTFGDDATITYQDSTTTSNFSSRSASVTLKNTSNCESGTIDLWLDKAFGTLLFATNLQNGCATQPLRTESFENLTDWQVQGGATATLSNNAVSGAHSLAISANGWTPITSIPLSSALLRGAATSPNLAAVSFALEIPTTQPNPYWIGAAQMYISAPSANVYNAYLGQVELTGLPQGAFQRLNFTIPDYALHALTEDHNDVTFTIVLNVNAGTTGWLVDDLRIGG